MNLAIRPVQSLKHVVDTATSAVAGGVTSTVILAEAETDPSPLSPIDVHYGSTISSIFLRVEVLHVGGNFNTVPRIYMAVSKNPGNEHVIANPSSIGDSDLRRYVLHQEMTMISAVVTNGSTFPRTMFVGVIKIPRGFKRMGINDRLLCSFALDDGELTGIVNACVQCIYKEFF